MENSEIIKELHDINERIVQLAQGSMGGIKMTMTVNKVLHALLQDYAEQMATLTLESKKAIYDRVIKRANLDAEESGIMKVVK